LRSLRLCGEITGMQIEFTKMHGLGNDFVVIDAVNQDVQLSSEQVRFIADRHFGVGCDQLLLVERPTVEVAEFRYRIYNADGGEVQQCGNGARCFARFVHDRGMTSSTAIPVETAGGMICLELEADGQVTVDMGVPSFDPASLPFETENIAEQEPEYHQLLVNGQKYAIGAVSVGNPHAVLLVESVDEAPVATLGAAIESHERFPERVNVGFMEILDRTHIRLRVFERGAGETLACGTGACAAVAVGIHNSLLDHTVQVALKGGNLTIRWQGNDHTLLMTGPAQTVYEGKITL
jgi:diaminopimelate epimerase